MPWRSATRMFWTTLPSEPAVCRTYAILAVPANAAPADGAVDGSVGAGLTESTVGCGVGGAPVDRGVKPADGKGVIAPVGCVTGVDGSTLVGAGDADSCERK
ncbi:MAG: hypothetical protein QOH61_1678 [Chloroflexota bacterium]|nr:hypothetical protein [Chloroflexota bacterium]